MSFKSQREMLEAAIAADFDDLAAHAAYADLLAEEGDPRGEYIQLRLALENPDQSPPLLAEWRERAYRLLQRHERDWLGRLGHFLVRGPRATVEPDTPNLEYTWKRGWLAELHVQDVRDAFTRVLADAPEARMLQVLTLRNTRLRNNHSPLEPLVGSPFLESLQAFTLGDPDSPEPTADGHRVPALVAGLPKLRALDLRAEGLALRELMQLPFSELRVLIIDFAAEGGLEFLAGNRSLTNLARLAITVRFGMRPPVADFDTYEAGRYYWLPTEELRAFLRSTYLGRLTDLTLRIDTLGDDGCREIARSGILRRLHRLDLRNCGITDAGAEALARSPDLGHLDWLDVGGNRLTPVGVSRLHGEVRVQYDSQWGD